MFDDFHSGEQHVQMSRNQFFHREERIDGGRRRRALDSHEPADVVGNLDASEVFAAGDGVLHRHGEVEAQSADVGERVSVIDCQRRQYREDLLVEMCRESAVVIGAEIGPPNDRNALCRQGRADRVEKHVRVLVGEFLGATRDERQLFAWGEAVGGPDRQSGLVAALESGDPDHEKLVEIGSEDGEELCAFEQRQ